MKVGEQTTENVGNDHLNDLHHSSNFSWFLFPATNAEIENCFKSFKTSACGYDDISPVVIKQTANIIVTPLTRIVNLTLKNGTFPDTLKKAKVIPLLKSGYRSDNKNYRPISVLPAFSKIFEKLLITISLTSLKIMTY